MLPGPVIGNHVRGSRNPLWRVPLSSLGLLGLLGRLPRGPRRLPAVGRPALLGFPGALDVRPDVEVQELRTVAMQWWIDAVARVHGAYGIRTLALVPDEGREVAQ